MCGTIERWLEPYWMLQEDRVLHLWKTERWVASKYVKKVTRPIYEGQQCPEMFAKRIWQCQINCSFTIMNSLMFANIGINETFVKFFWLNKFRVHMLLQCSNISSHFQPMLSTVLPCWIKTFQHVRLEPELLLWLPELQPSSRVSNSRKRSFSLSRTLLPLSSVKAPAGYSYKNSNNRKQKIESALGTMGLMRALFFFLSSLEASAEERALLPRETWENGWNSCRLWRQLFKN